MESEGFVSIEESHQLFDMALQEKWEEKEREALANKII